MPDEQGNHTNQGIPSMGRELIVIVKPEAGLRVTKGSITSAEGVDVSSLANLIASEGVILRPLFGPNEESLKAKAASMRATSGAKVPDLSVYYRVEAPDERLDALAARLREQDIVEAAYVKPQPQLPAIPPAELPPGASSGLMHKFNDMKPLIEEPPSISPDFTANQGYLKAASDGVNAVFAWTLPGGQGQGVNIIDIEGAWRFTHEDLQQNKGGVVSGVQSTDPVWINHGTAVLGEFSGDNNGFGVTGICSDAFVRTISIFGPGSSSSASIQQAADLLNAGDIILIELHYPGPRYNYQNRPDQLGFIPIEWWEDNFDAISYAVSKGVIVVEAGGNGAENLDDPLYNTPGPGFPGSWTNPFNRANRDSGAIVVGAGAPPSGNFGPDRSRLDFSNYGSMIDVQGWGREVTTCSYGDLQGGSNADVWYTSNFSGTSSASPIVVGTLGCIQGILHAQGTNPLSSSQARNLLRTTGSPQQDAPSKPATQQIGNRPDLSQIIATVIGPRVTSVNPNSGPSTGGTSVVITGTSFTGATAVGFTNSGSMNFSVDSDTQITAVSPAGTGTVDITVTTPNGASVTSPDDQFTYI